MALSTKVQKHIWGLFAGRCALCKESLIEDDDSARSLVGEVAHVAGDKPGAARYDPAMTEADRSDPDNLLLLCRKHHKIIDDNEEEFTVNKLTALRDEYLAWLSTRLAIATAWNLRVSAFTYLNVPRLVEYATLQGFRVRSPEIRANGTLHELGFELNRVMEDFRRPLESMVIESVSADQIDFAHEGYIGQAIRFDRLRFRTKNMPVRIPTKAVANLFKGSLATDPHIYHRFRGWTLVFNIDPRWITTSTAFTLFRPSGGASVFTGFGRIHSVDLENALMTGTALAVGIPLSEFDLAGNSHIKARPNEVDLESLEDHVTRSRGGRWFGEVPNCDFCGRSFSGEKYMIDGPLTQGGLWGCMCSTCYSKSRLPLGVGKGQLYRWERNKWRLVGGYARPLEVDEK